MSYDNIDRRRVAFCVVINGLPHRYCEGIGPGSDVGDGYLYDYTPVIVQTPVDLLDAVISVGPTEATLDDLSGVIDQTAVEVVIRARDARAGGQRYHPFETLMRTAGPPSATLALKLAETLDHAPLLDGPADIAVTKSASAWTLPGPVHIGQEVLWADGFSDPGGGVHLLTDCTRAADRYVSQDHVVSAEDREQPWVTSDVTAWHGRRAAVYVTAVLNDGTAAGWVQYWKGYIDSAPEMDGDRVKLRIAPLTRVMGYRLGVGSAARTARSVAQAHRFRVGVGDRLDAIIRWEFSAVSLRAVAANVGANTVTLEADDAAALLSFGRLASAAFIVPGQSGAPETGATLAGSVLTFGAGSEVVIQVDAVLGGGATTVEVQMRGTFSERFPLRLVDPTGGADQVVAWPKTLTDVVNAAQAWQPGPIESWADPVGGGGEDRIGRLRLTSAGRWQVVGQMREGLSGTPGTPGLIGAGAGTGRVSIIRGGRVCWAGIIMAEGLDDVRGARASDGNRIPNRSVAFDGPVGFADGGIDPTRYPIDGPAVWWYQSGEPFIGPFSANVYTGGRQQISLTLGESVVTMWVDSATSDTHPTTGDTVWWYEVVNPDAQRSIVQMDGDPPVELQVIAGVNDTDPGRYIIQLLTSGIGNGDNGVNDALPIGANVPGDPANHIDHDSFTAAAVPAPLQGQDYTAVRGETIQDQAEGLLLAMGAQVAAQYSATLDDWRITLTDTGPADSESSVLTLTDADIERVRGLPRVVTKTDGRVVRSYKVTMNHPAFGAEGEPQTYAVSANAERNDGGADSGEPLELDLPGVRAEGDGGIAQAAVELVANIRARVGVPRVRWVFAIRADMPGALALGICDVVTLTSSTAIALRPTDAVASVPCRVVGIKRDLPNNRLALEVRPFPAVTGGWAPSARVATVPTADSVTVEAGDFSSSDGGYIAAGDKLTGIAPGDWAGRVSLTVLTSVTSLGVTTVTFTGAHTLAVGDILRTQDYATAVTSQQGWAFLADDGVLGSGAGRVIG